MRTVIQKVTEASVTIDGQTKRTIGPGMVILLGIEEADQEADIHWLCRKISQLRIFNDHNGVMNLSVLDLDGEVMLISQFTLHASTKKGNRPSYIKAAPPETAIPLYQSFIKQMEMEMKKPVICGEFGAYMQLSLTNDGPVTISIDSKNRE